MVLIHTLIQPAADLIYSIPKCIYWLKKLREIIIDKENMFFLWGGRFVCCCIVPISKWTLCLCIILVSV